jgi:integrase
MSDSDSIHDPTPNNPQGDQPADSGEPTRPAEPEPKPESKPRRKIPPGFQPFNSAGSVAPRPDRGKEKPAKPYPDFPLTAHPSGVWCKKIKGRLFYFGPWDDPDGALAKYLEQKDALHCGKAPRPDPQVLTVKDIANLFLTAKQRAVEAGELSPRTWAYYRSTMDMLVAGFGKGKLVSTLDPQDFSGLKANLVKTNGPARMSVVITVIRSAFKYAFEVGELDRPMRFGPDFKRTAKKVMRIHRSKQGAKLFTADEIRRMLNTAGPQLRAMIFLGINCGFGNSDCGNLPLSALDLEQGWIDYPRPKTGIARRCPLWPETVEALKEAIARRPRPKHEEHAGLVFITKYGLSWSKTTAETPITKEVCKLLRGLEINGRNRLGFYTLRHTFRTIADEAKDQPAADALMGHESPHMSTVYRERISDDRLRAVADYVHKWLFGTAS